MLVHLTIRSDPLLFGGEGNPILVDLRVMSLVLRAVPLLLQVLQNIQNIWLQLVAHVPHASSEHSAIFFSFSVPFFFSKQCEDNGTKDALYPIPAQKLLDGMERWRKPSHIKHGVMVRWWRVIQRAIKTWNAIINQVQAGPVKKSRTFYPTRFPGRFRTPKNAVYMAE